MKFREVPQCPSWTPGKRNPSWQPARQAAGLRVPQPRQQPRTLREIKRSLVYEIKKMKKTVAANERILNTMTILVIDCTHPALEKRFRAGCRQQRRQLGAPEWGARSDRAARAALLRRRAGIVWRQRRRAWSVVSPRLSRRPRPPFRCCPRPRPTPSTDLKRLMLQRCRHRQCPWDRSRQSPPPLQNARLAYNEW